MEDFNNNIKNLNNNFYITNKGIYKINLNDLEEFGELKNWVSKKSENEIKELSIKSGFTYEKKSIKVTNYTKFNIDNLLDDIFDRHKSDIAYELTIKVGDNELFNIISKHDDYDFIEDVDTINNKINNEFNIMIENYAIIVSYVYDTLVVQKNIQVEIPIKKSLMQEISVFTGGADEKKKKKKKSKKD